MKRAFLPILCALLLAVAAIPAQAIQCVPYAREVSGLNLKGNAWQWWHAAAGLYERGRSPRDGSVLVFSRQGSMRYGHVAVVTRVVSNRLVLVDHANWAPAGSEGRGKVTQAVPVLDVSERNDWSQVRVWYRPADDYGSKVYRAEGFVHQPGQGASAPRPTVERVAMARAARIFPRDTAFTRHAEPAAAVASLPATAPVVPAAVQPAPQPVVVSEHTRSHPSTEDLVRVARHTFLPRATRTARAAAVDDFLFN